MKAPFPFRLRTIYKIVLFLLLSAGAVAAFVPTSPGMQYGLNDKLLHAVAFFVLSAAYHLAYPLHPLKWSVAGLMLYGFIIEIVQSMIPYRQFSLLDMVANVLGIVVYFYLLAPVVYRKLINRP